MIVPNPTMPHALPGRTPCSPHLPHPLRSEPRPCAASREGGLCPGAAPGSPPALVDLSPPSRLQERGTLSHDSGSHRGHSLGIQPPSPLAVSSDTRVPVGDLEPHRLAHGWPPQTPIRARKVHYSAFCRVLKPGPAHRSCQRAVEAASELPATVLDRKSVV